MKTNAKNLVVFDIETEQFSQAFVDAKTLEEKTKHVPTMRVCCLFEERTGDYKYYTENNVKDLIAALRSADEIVTYNGENFDFLVLKKHYGLKGLSSIIKKHTDMFNIMVDGSGYWASLNDAALCNLGEHKHTKGRDMGALDLNELEEACKSDVSQTYRLWQKYMDGTLEYPQQRYRKRRSSDEREYALDGPGSQLVLPPVCPCCGDVGSLVIEDYEPEDIEDMTDGQLADYMAGWDAIVVCESCGSIIE